MQAPTIGCIGKCTIGLTVEELDEITDNISRTLSHPKGRQIFERYLQQRNLQSSLQCFVLYEICSEFITKELNQSQSMESLIIDVTMMKENAEELDGVSQIDKTLLVQFNEALTSNTEGKREALLTVLKNTRDRLQDFLKGVHDSFKQYVSEPCPLRK